MGLCWSHTLQHLIGNLLPKACTAGNKNKSLFGDAHVLQSRVGCLYVLNSKSFLVMVGHKLKRKLLQKSRYLINRLGFGSRFPDPRVSLGVGDGLHSILQGLVVKYQSTFGFTRASSKSDSASSP